MKACTKCRQEKPLEEFGLDSRAKDGRQRQCLQCRRKQRSVWKDAHPEEQREMNLAWYEKNYERHREATLKWQRGNREKMHDSMLRSRYGITLEERQRMYVEQQGKCKICGEAAPLVVDHVHDRSRRVRGLLCKQCNIGKCNIGIGTFREDVEIMRAAIAYL